MKTVFIRRGLSTRLILFFGGWGMDEHPLGNLFSTSDADLCICYDYTDLSLDFTLFQLYQEIRLYAWSMGVWAAATVFEHTTLPFVQKTAINGTMTPIDDERGIPIAIFDGTLANLDDRNLDKFNRRMCGSRLLKEWFDQHRPARTTIALKQELQCIRDQFFARTVPQWHWDKAMIGEKDLIFPPLNQKRAWEAVPQQRTEDAHLPLFFTSENEVI